MYDTLGGKISVPPKMCLRIGFFFRFGHKYDCLKIPLPIHAFCPQYILVHCGLQETFASCEKRERERVEERKDELSQAVGKSFEGRKAEDFIQSTHPVPPLSPPYPPPTREMRKNKEMGGCGKQGVSAMNVSTGTIIFFFPQ